MTRRQDRDAIYVKRQFDTETIVLCVRWYITYRLSYRDLVAMRLLRREHPAWRRVRVRSSKYLNNIIEQDHRAIKRRCASMKGFKSFANAAVTIAGVELAHRIHKHQFSLGRGRPRNDRSLRTDWERAVA